MTDDVLLIIIVRKLALNLVLRAKILVEVVK
jgi:hypothetical protein